MKTETKYLIPEGNLDFENRINSFGDTTSDEMTFSYIFTMVGEELLQQKVYNYNNKYQNNENINGNLSNDSNFNQYQRDRLSSVASTIDDTGSDDFFINNDGEHSFRPRAQSSSDTEQDCYIIDQIFSKDDDDDDDDEDDDNDDEDDENDDDLDCNNMSKFKSCSPNKNMNDDLNYKSIHLQLDKVHIPFETNLHDDNKRKENSFIQIVDEDLLKVYDSDEKSSNVNEMILTLFDNVNEIKDNNNVNEIKDFEQNKNYSQCDSQNIKTLNNDQTYNIKTEKNENFIEQNNQTEYFTKWFTDEISSLKQSTSELLMIDCDESVSSLTISEDSSYTNNNVNNSCNNGFKGFKTYLNTPTCVNNNSNNNPLPPIETMLRQGMRGASFNSMIRKNCSSLHFKPKPYDNENGEFGHLNCRQTWQKSTVNDMNCNITDNQVVVSQSEGAVVDMLPRVKEDVTSGLLECRWEDCWALFQGQPALVRHIEKTHVELRRGEDFACLWQACPRRTRPFNARYKLLIHMRVHSGEKPNKCPFQGCLKAFSRLENLKIHQRSHTGERPYACQFQGCPKAFSNSSDRAKHQRTHFDTKPYACQVIGCSKRYTDPSSLRKHIKNHGGLSTGRTKKLVASEPIVSPNELKARQHYETATSLPSPAVPESSPKVELKNEPEISNEVPTITDLSDAMNEYIPYESVHHLLDEDCVDPSGWEEEMSAEIEREFLSLTSDYNASLMDVNEDNDNCENDYR